MTRIDDNEPQRELLRARLAGEDRVSTARDGHDAGQAGARRARHGAPVRDVIANERELSASEVRRYALRQRDMVYRLDYVIVGGNGRRRVTTHHHIGSDDLKR